MTVLHDLDQLDRLDGLITPAVGRALYDLARQVPASRAIVEIGAWRGMSSCYLAAGARAGAGAPVFSVDPWDPTDDGWCRWCPKATIEEWREQTAAFPEITAVQALSVDAARVFNDQAVGLLVVDGDHHVDAVIADVEAWLPHLHVDAVIVFDDYMETINPGVAEAVTALRVRVLDPAIRIVAGRCAVATLRREGQ